MESLSVAIWRMCLIQAGWIIYRIEYIFRPFKIQRGDELLLGVLGVILHRCAATTSCGTTPLLDIRQIPLQPGHAIAVRSPPDAGPFYQAR